VVAATPTVPEGPEVHQRLGPYEVVAAVGFGPRVTGLTGNGSGQLLARLGPEVRIDNPESGTYVFRGATVCGQHPRYRRSPMRRMITIVR
jgi:hypothetical protein